MNFISKGSIVLVGLRHWENEHKNVDLIEVYNSSEVSQLRKLPNLDFRPIDEVILSMGGGAGISSFDSNDIQFSNDISQEDTQPTPTLTTHEQTDDITDSFDFQDI